MRDCPGGVCAPRGYQAAGVAAGIKKRDSDKKDVAVIISQAPAIVAGVFTTNKVQAAPVLWSKEVVNRGQARVIVANSGNANACTGEQGLADARAMATQVAALSGGEITAEEVIVASTGVIGVPLPMDVVESGITRAWAQLNPEGSGDAAAAIMTTDTFAKETAVEIEIAGQPVRVGGIAKGSGMIHPNMATMLAFITTDARVDGAAWQALLKEAVDQTFNMVTVDGDTSTNDMVVALANGLAGPESALAPGQPGWEELTLAVTEVCRRLAIAIARDGEGATRLLTVEVTGAISLAAARLAARTIAGSSLVKSAIFGADANWGRIMAALGYSGAEFDPQAVSISFRAGEKSLLVFQEGAPVPFAEEEARALLAEKEVTIEVDLAQGRERATAWGCDLTYDYVRINADYRT
ncbi:MULTISPECIES: bifunctional glutamate N-acetyltransferase/amino-acid acetyltransferase ArgJ [unclassified Carboxydocella]|uniref:bifunctional glutamate N-acetyltransferase/amino-acid acetyltransferase ArgJ n=1 Tax=unclassified Carboxydocella TaxID=2685367 RepID=UPI0009ADFC8B|nr:MULTISPECIES: bifunctional glutamate N-acetyltransferase/amino-acid acetyltransferase ArgJ [unclassified Carboxydocella]GAW27606.1 ornithine acetyltransferase [Carboxydocella sp. ULO1]GAW31801.1 ornithine acetyltransferase [Carboxydocella sp. JDF658]